MMVSHALTARDQAIELIYETLEAALDQYQTLPHRIVDTPDMAVGLLERLEERMEEEPSYIMGAPDMDDE